MQPDLQDLQLQDEVIEVDGKLSSEEFFKIKLPDDGEHEALVSLGDRGLKIARQKDKSGQRNGAAYINGHLALQLLNDLGQPAGMVFDNPTSIIMQSAGTSKLHAILDLCGEPAPSRCTIGELVAHAERVFAQKPKVKVITQWEASVNRGSQQSPDYETICKGQKRFPQVQDESGAPTGRFDQEILDPKTGEKVQAQVRVVRYSRA